MIQRSTTRTPLCTLALSNLSTSVPTVLLWRKRYEKDGLQGILADLPRGGRPKRITTEREAAIVEATMKTTPKDATHWSIRAMGAAQKVSAATVQRIWNKHKLQPHRVESFKFSNDLRNFTQSDQRLHPDLQQEPSALPLGRHPKPHYPQSQ
jgi:transposase